MKIILVAIAVVLGAATITQAALMTRMWDPPWNPFRPSPEQVLAQMVQKSKELDAFHLVQVFGMQGTTGKVNIDANLHVASDINQASLAELKAHSFFTINLDIIDQSLPAQTEQNLQLAAEGELISTGDTSYIRLSSLSLPEFFETLFVIYSFGLEPNQFTNQWIRFDQKELLAFSGLDEELIAQELQNQTQLQQDLQELLLSPEFYVIRQELPDEEIDGQKMYHYVLEIKVAEMLDAIFTKVFAQEELTGGDAFAAEIAKGAVKGIVDAFLQKVGPITSDMWIDKETLYLRKALIQKTIDLGQFDPKQTGTVAFQYEMAYSDFNKPVSIAAPAQSTSLSELLAPLLESLMRQPASSSLPLQTPQMRDAQRRADIIQVHNALKLYYAQYGQYPIPPGFPSSFGSIMPVTPRDPGNGIPDCEIYQWVQNVQNPQSYCAYACLEQGGFFVASPRGAFALPVPPPSLEACES